MKQFMLLNSHQGMLSLTLTLCNPMPNPSLECMQIVTGKIIALDKGDYFPTGRLLRSQSHIFDSNSNKK